MKYLSLLSLLFFISSYFIFISNPIEENTQVVITIPNLTIEDLSNLNKEFKRHSNIQYINGSVEGGTIAINVDENNFNKHRIETMLNKWNCTATSFDYINLLDVAVVE